MMKLSNKLVQNFDVKNERNLYGRDAKTVFEAYQSISKYQTFINEELKRIASVYE